MENATVMQKAILENIRKNVPLKSILAGIYSHVPENALYPFIRIANIKIEKDIFASVMEYKYKAELEVFSDKNSSIECIHIMEMLDALLSNTEFTDEKYIFSSPSIINSSVEQLENRSWHGKMSFIMHGALLN